MLARTSAPRVNQWRNPKFQRRAVTLMIVAVVAVAAAVVALQFSGSSAGAADNISSKSFDLHANNSQPSAIWSNGTTMWVADKGGRLYAYKLADGTRDSDKDVTTLAGAGNDDPVGLWSDGTKIWVCDNEDNKIYVYTLSAGVRQEEDEFSVEYRSPDAPYFNSFRGIWSDEDTLWVADHAASKTYAFDLDTGNRRNGRNLEQHVQARNFKLEGVWSDKETMWVADSHEDKLFAYWLSNGNRRGPMELKGLDSGNAAPAGVWSNGLTMWVLDTDDDKVYAYPLPKNAALKSLSMTDVLATNFRWSKKNYSWQAASSVDTTTVSYEPEYSGAVVTIVPADDATTTEGHQVGLSSGNNTISVTVTHADATTTYTVVVDRTASNSVSDDATLSNLTLSGITLDNFQAEVRKYETVASSTLSSTTVAPTRNESNATIVIKPDDSDGGTEGHQVDLSEGTQQGSCDRDRVGRQDEEDLRRQSQPHLRC